MKPLPVLSMAGLFLVAAMAAAQDADPDLRNRVVVVENVKYDYAQVLNVEPVFQLLRATRTEEHCEPVSTRTLDPVKVVGETGREKGKLGGFWSSVRRIFGGADSEESAAVPAVPAEVVRRDPLLTRNCQVVEVGREFRRPIAYDVDYVYRGTKYRSRLPEDPGNRLRIRVSITPVVSGMDESAASQR